MNVSLFSLRVKSEYFTLFSSCNEWIFYCSLFTWKEWMFCLLETKRTLLETNPLRAFFRRHRSAIKFANLTWKLLFLSIGVNAPCSHRVLWKVSIKFQFLRKVFLKLQRIAHFSTRENWNNLPTQKVVVSPQCWALLRQFTFKTEIRIYAVTRYSSEDVDYPQFSDYKSQCLDAYIKYPYKRFASSNCSHLVVIETEDKTKAITCNRVPLAVDRKTINIFKHSLK